MGKEMPLYGEIPQHLHRLVAYAGDGFLLSASFGSAYHFIKGLRNSPSGGRLAAGVRAVRTNVPRVAGIGGAYLALFWALETATSLARNQPREDHWNSIAAGAASSAVVNAHRGAPAATLFAFFSAASFEAGAWWTYEAVHSHHHWMDHEARTGCEFPPLEPIAIAPCRAIHGDPIIGSIE